jgi:hypothetical protein
MDVCMEIYIDGCKFMWMDRVMGVGNYYGMLVELCGRQMKIEEDWRIYLDGCKIIWMDRAMGLLHS